MTGQLMTNIHWEDVECHLCGKGSTTHPLQLRGRPLVDGQFGFAVHPVICECGLIFLSPRWSPKDYRIFYENDYDRFYRLENKPDYGPAAAVKNMEVIWERICKYTPHPHTILDIGCGMGYGLKYLKECLPGSSIFGIESSPECCRFLLSEHIEATLVTTDFDSDWQKDWANTFDLIILRHVVEHMLFPLQSLRKLSGVLSDGGVIYISTPDMMSPRLILRDYNNWWEYWFRPVHPYYYSQATLFQTLDKANLYPRTFGCEREEVWCMASDKPTVSYDFEDVYLKQKDILDLYLK